MKTGQVRIIGGEWKGRKLNFPLLEGLRPTPNRVKETVFNWLAPLISGSICLDLFAGSGSLGFEALSRGAAYVVFVDKEISVIKFLNQQLTHLKATDRAGVYPIKINFKKELSTAEWSKQCFNIVFLDPPFKGNLLKLSFAWLEAKNFLTSDAYIYVESSEDEDDNDIPLSWHLIKTKIAGQVKYRLFHRALDFK